MKNLFAAVAVFLLSFPAMGTPFCPQAPDLSVQKELEAMVEADQALRGSENSDPEKEVQADLAHRQRVLALLAAGRIDSAEQKFMAALLLQHTPAMICEGKLTSQSRENYLLAHYLALASAEAGYRPARRMVAMTLDRYLWMCGKAQKYGTNFTVDEKTGKRILEPLDRATSDEERALWDVEPLRVLKGE